MVTNAPIKNTTTPVNNLPILKQKPVADARMAVGKICGIYTASAPWLMPKKKASKIISIYVNVEKDVLSLNSKNVNKKQAAKHISMVLRKPIALAIHPEAKLPAKPPEAMIMIVSPRIFCALETEEIF